MTRPLARTPLRRLMPRRELEALLSTLSPLLPDATLRVLDASGAVVGALTPDPEAGTVEALAWRGELRLDGVVVGTFEALPSSGSSSADLGVSTERVASVASVASVARGVLEQALEGALVRREMGRETLERYREVNLAYRLGEVLAAGFDLAGLPRKVLDEALRVVRAGTALVVLEDEGGERVAAVVGSAADDSGLRAALSSARSSSKDGRAVVDSAALSAGAPHALRVWAPLAAGERNLGGVLLTRSAGDAEFSAGDAKLLAALAAQAATYLDNARMHQQAVEQARLARELQLAHEVQARLMPSELPACGGWELAAWWSAAREVAGDFYDATLHEGSLNVSVGDVADKGMAAALFMALTRSVLRASAGDGRGPGEVLERANALLCADATDGMFVTLVHAQLLPDGRVRYANGGHNPPLVARADGELELLSRTGILVGWDADVPYGEGVVELAPGDALVLYTDGVTEARSGDGGEYGEERLEALVRRSVVAGGSAGELVASLRAELATFVGAADAFDDATFLVARRVAPACG